jgi:alpha-1,2-mannosyltransferase
MSVAAARHAPPPLWLAAAATAAGWGALYSIGRWIFLFLLQPIHEDVRITYVAAEVGLRFGWSRIYDVATLQALSASFPAGQNTISSSATYINPPLWAWLFVPLTAFPEPVAYAVWAVLSLMALIYAWHIAAPYFGFAKYTLLLAALALWPVMDAFYRGQPSIILLALVAFAWKLCREERPVAAGVVLALATALKPQAAILVPIALLVSGHYRPVMGWVAGSAVLGVATVIVLGPSGLASWWQALAYVQSDISHAYFTLAYLFGLGPVTYALLAIQGAAALAVAWRRRSNLEVVFAVGLLGSLATSFHLHVYDYSSLVLAAWLILRTSPPLWHRLWLVVCVATMQALPLGLPVPQLIWDAAWLGILLVSNFAGSGASALATRRAGESAVREGT